MDERKEKGSMLINRRIGEAVEIGEGIEVIVVTVTRGLVKLRVTAPKAVRVSRSEEKESAE
jgi:carbon storage regulator CsrA